MKRYDLFRLSAVTAILTMLFFPLTVDVSLASANLPGVSSQAYLPVIIKPVEVFVLPNHSAFMTSWGSLHIVGEIQNNSSYHLAGVKIGADLLNGRGYTIAGGETYTYLEKIPSGQKTCFDITILDAPSNWANYTFKDLAYSLSSEMLPNLALLYATHVYNTSSGEYELSGQVRNDQGRRVECVKPVGTLYNDDGMVTGCEFSYVSSVHLNAGQSSLFEIEFYGRDYRDTEYYQIAVDGHIP